MSWAGVERSLPQRWLAIRRFVLERDGYACQWREDGRICGAYANQVDHKGDRADHRPDNLRALCESCHKKRTAQQGGSASHRARGITTLPRRRPQERHPFLS